MFLSQCVCTEFQVFIVCGLVNGCLTILKTHRFNKNTHLTGYNYCICFMLLRGWFEAPPQTLAAEIGYPSMLQGKDLGLKNWVWISLGFFLLRSPEAVVFRGGFNCVIFFLYHISIIQSYSLLQNYERFSKSTGGEQPARIFLNSL